MTMQEAIDQKQWPAIIDDNTFYKQIISWRGGNYDSLNFTSEAFEALFIQNTLWIENAAFASHVSVYAGLRNIMMYGYIPTIQDLRKLMVHVKNNKVLFGTNYKYAVRYFAEFMVPDRTPDGYFELLIEMADDDDDLAPWDFDASYKEMEMLSEEAQDFLKSVTYDWGKNMIINFDKEGLFLIFGKDSVKDMLTRTPTKTGRYGRRSTPNVLSRFEDDFDITEMFDIGDNVAMVDTFYQWLGITILPVEASDILDYSRNRGMDAFDTLSAKIAKHLTVDELTQLKSLIKVYPGGEIIAKDGSLEAYADNTDKNAQQSNARSTAFLRFYTEEEIAQHPDMFNYSDMKYSQRFYISRPTMTIINRAWDKRSRFNKDGVEFTSLLDQNKNQIFSKNDLGYLIKKTKASNKEIIEALSAIKKLDEYPELKNIKPLLRLLAD